MNDLEGSSLLDNAIDGIALGTMEHFPSLCVNSFEGSCTLQVLEIGLAEGAKVLALCRLVEEHCSARLADDLEDGYGMLEKAPMEDGQDEADVAVVTYAVNLRETARLAIAGFRRYTLSERGGVRGTGSERTLIDTACSSLPYLPVFYPTRRPSWASSPTRRSCTAP